jgi:hypothetical protein
LQLRGALPAAAVPCCLPCALRRRAAPLRTPTARAGHHGHLGEAHCSPAREFVHERPVAEAAMLPAQFARVWVCVGGGEG